MRVILLIAFFFSSSVLLQGQSPNFCYTNPVAKLEAKSHNYIDHNVKDNKRLTFKIAAYIIRDTNGLNGVSQDDVNRTLCQANLDYQSLGVKFKIVSLKYIDSDKRFYVADGATSVAEIIERVQSQMAETPNREAVRIFFYPSRSPDGNNFRILNGGVAEGIPGTSIALGGYTGPEAIIGSHIVTHELGHCFGLFHTFHGICEYGEFENVGDTISCDLVGDEVCDTKPSNQAENVSNPFTCEFISKLEDPNLPFLTCATEKDMNGVPFPKADIDNYMSYAPPKCMLEFKTRTT